MAFQSNYLCVLSQQQQQQEPYGFQDEEERSLNSLDDDGVPAFALLGPPSRSRSRGTQLDQDRQLLEDIFSYLTAPSSSSASSSSSSSSFLSDLDFPLDFDDNYVSQMTRLKEQQQQQLEKERQQEEEEEKRKQQQKFDTLSALDGESMAGNRFNKSALLTPSAT